MCMTHYKLNFVTVKTRKLLKILVVLGITSARMVIDRDWLLFLTT